jgi:hypothetical protein
MRPTVKLRGFPGTVALGLLASLVAHAALFGGGHTLGGASHALVVSLATAAFVGFIVCFAGLAWVGAGRIADGTILARTLLARLPSMLPIAIAAIACYATIESIEPAHHTMDSAAALLALVAAAWLVRALAAGAIRLLAGGAIAIRRHPFALRALVRLRVGPAPVVLSQRAPRRRRFARPPPIGNVVRA